MNRPIVNVTEGKLQGTTLKSVLGPDYLAFKGIPYAQPPLGPLRFEKPQAPKPWEGIRDASEHAGDIAPQYQFDIPEPVYNIIGSEDCLYLNVYTNTIGRKRPVMFYIHGGGFVEGTGNDCIYRQDYLVTTDVVLVCVNYRLGPLGFLNLGHKLASGNQGLRDVIFALKWVKKNIEAFGGDPDNVTIFGNSAGSMICHLFTLLPDIRDLFHKAILQSGSMFMEKNLLKNGDFRNGYKIASLLDFNSDDPEKVLEFLRTVPAENLIKLQNKVLSKWERKILGFMEYAPVYDGDYCDDPIIPLPFVKLLNNDANIPIMIGNTLNESLLFFIGELDDVELYEYYNENIEEFVKNHLLLRDLTKFPEVMRNIRKFYLKNKPINRKNAWNFINLTSDLLMINNNRKIIDLRIEHANVSTYVYCFSYMGDEPTFYSFDEGPQPLQGVAHADELSYMFYITYMRKTNEHDQYPREGTKDRIVLDRMVRLWFNFALTGNPTPKIDNLYITTIWKPVEKCNLYYLDIGNELILKNDRDSEERSIYEKFD